MTPFLKLKPTSLELKEEMNAPYVGAKHRVTVGNGLDALRIALVAHDIEPSDKVIVPAHMDASPLEGAMTRTTKAIIPVHLYGQSADMDPSCEFSPRHGLVVIGDTAQAHRACFRGKMCGALRHAAAFSFYPRKNLGAFSVGGAITTNDDAVARRACKLRNNGSEKCYHHQVAGTDSRLDQLQAVFLRVKLRNLAEWNLRRAAITERYQFQLSTLRSWLSLSFVHQWSAPVWQLFMIRSNKRDLLQQHSVDRGIQTVIHYPMLPYRGPAYQSHRELSFALTEEIIRRILSLLCGPHFTTEQIEACANQINSSMEFQR
ncbi:MAG: erythromycin biosynthesis sensory transduction protein eryC1 [Verrucomicrobia bacterium]|nr:MAG: erythromycin biosynthesis sensory transduction protein eryC1 [Verrucomicrobiota bacterium]